MREDTDADSVRWTFQLASRGSQRRRYTDVVVLVSDSAAMVAGVPAPDAPQEHPKISQNH